MDSETITPFERINFDHAFKDTLTFVTELCEVSFAFITHRDASDSLVITKMGFDSVAIPDEILRNNQNVITQNTVITIGDLSQDAKPVVNKTKGGESDFNFFVGVPVCNNQNEVVGSICILDLKAKELTNAQLKSLEFATKQISYKLEVFAQNKAHDDALREKERQFELFKANSNEIVYEIDLDGVYRYLSKNWTALLGYEVEEALGKDITLFLHPDDLEMCRDHLNTIVKTGNFEKELAYRIKHKSGHYVWHSSKVKFSENKGKPVFVGNCWDVTEFIETKQGITQQKEFYEKILDQMPTDVAVFDQDHNYLYLNRLAIQNDELRAFIIGKDDFEYAKRTGRDDATARDRRARFLQTLESRTLNEWEDNVYSPFTGLTTYHNRRLNPVFDKNGAFEMMVGFAVDITSIKNTEKEILKSKKLLKSIIDNVAVGLLIQGPQSEILENNQAACDMLGLTKDQLIGKTSFDKHWKVIHFDGTEFLPEEHPVPKAIQLLQPVKNVVMGVYRPVTADMVWLLVDAIPVFDDLGELLHVVCSFNDITKLKKIEDDLKISNERFTYARQATSDAIWDWNMTTDEIFVGSSYTEIFGHEVKNNAILYSEWGSMMHPDDRERCASNFLDVVADEAESNWIEEYRFLKSDGTYAYVHDKAIIIRDDEGKAIRMIGAMQDITERKKLENDLKLSNERFTYARQATTDAIWDWTMNSEQIFVGSSFTESFGHQVKNNTILFTEWGSFVHPEDIERCRLNFYNHIKDKTIDRWSDEFRYLRADGTYAYVHDKAIIIRDDEGKAIRMIGAMQDITERKKLENDLKLSNERFTYASLATSDAIVDWDIRTDEITVSSNYSDLFGYNFKNNIYLGSEWGGFIHPDDRERVILKGNTARENKNFNKWSDEYRYLKADGTYAYVHDHAIIMRDENGIATRMIGAIKDISKRKELEEELKSSNERFRLASQATSDAIWDWDITTDEIRVGPSYAEIFGRVLKNNAYSNSEWESLVHPEDQEVLFSNLNNLLEDKTIMKWSAEYRYRRADGTYANVVDKAVIIRDEDGQAIRMIGALHDISKRKKLQEDLKQSEAQFKGAFENSPVGMALVDVEGKYIEVNNRLCDIFGYSSQELKSLTFQEITHEDDLEIDLEYKRDLDLGKISHFSSEKRFVKKDATAVWTNISVALERRNKNEIYYIVQVVDISERKKIEEENKILIEESNKKKKIELNEAKNMYRFLAENSVDLIGLHSLDTSFKYISPSVVNILGYTPEEMEGTSPFDYAHPEDLKYLKDSFTGYFEGTVKDTVIARYLNKWGKYVWLETKASIVKENDIIAGFQSTSRDVSIRKEEESIINSTLAKERELNELRSNLVSTVSHEFRTPMTTIRTSTELISTYLEGQNFEKKSRLEKQLSTIAGEIDRIVDLMNSVLTISKDDAGKTKFNPTQLDLKQLCLKIIETSFAKQSHGGKVQTYFYGDNFDVFADENLMEYSIFNVLSNAFKYSQGSSDVVLQLSSSASTVTVQVIDQGIGIPAEDQQKLFNTFFRASNTDGIQGTGLGLYIVKTFTEKNSGTVKLDSVLGKGTTITLEFPLKNV